MVLAAGGLLAPGFCRDARRPDRLHPKVLAAFRESISEPSKSTVQVYCDGYRGALGAIVDPNGYVADQSQRAERQDRMPVAGQAAWRPRLSAATRRSIWPC